MSTLKERIKKDLNNWEEDIQKLKNRAEEKKTEKKIKYEQKIRDLQTDMEKLKASLRMHLKNNTEPKIASDFLMKDNHIKVKEGMSSLKDELGIKKNVYKQALSETYEQIKDDIDNFYEFAKANKDKSKDKLKETVSAVGHKIDHMEESAKRSWASMSDSAKENYKKNLGKLKSKKDEMSKWLKEKFS